MSISASCQSIASSLAHNLRVATSEDGRHLFATEALVHLEKVLLALHALQVEKGADSKEYWVAREAVLDLLTTAGITFVRSCTQYGNGVLFLAAMAAKTTDPLLRKKLVTYSNQLKRRWTDAEHGINRPQPAALRRKGASSDDKLLTSAVMVIVVAVLCGVIYSSVLPAIRGEEGAPVSYSGGDGPQTHTPEPPPKLVTTSDDPTPAIPGPKDYCTYSDDAGVVHLVNDLSAVPERYRPRLRVVAGGGGRRGVAGSTTPVTCARDRVLVPVKLRYQGREVETVLLLDTGATVTTINTDVATRLGLTWSSLQPGRATVADGRTVATSNFAADLLSVGPKSVACARISILPGSGGDGAEGLLGMNFLREFRYHVDFKRGVIEWGS